MHHPTWLIVLAFIKQICTYLALHDLPFPLSPPVVHLAHLCHLGQVVRPCHATLENLGYLGCPYTDCESYYPQVDLNSVPAKQEGGRGPRTGEVSFL